MTPNLRQLEYFLAVADEGHFGRGAARLMVSPASVSEAVATLERRLGTRLFDRTTRRVRLTADGIRFLDDVRAPYEALSRAHDAARGRAQQRDDLVIAHTPELGQLLLPPLLARSPGDPALHAWRPVMLHTPDQMRAVEDGRADLGLCWSVGTRSTLGVSVLGTVPTVAVLRRDDPLAARDTLPLALLRDRPLLVTPRSDNPFIDSRLHADLVKTGVPMANLVEIDRYEELPIHVATGDRIGLHPGSIVLLNRVPGVVFRPIVEPSVQIQICALSQVDPEPPVAALIATLTGVVEHLDLPKVADTST